MEKIIGMLVAIFSLLIPQLKKVDSKVGVEETKEMIIGMNELSLVLLKKFKDGVQFSDFTQLYSEISADDEFKRVMEVAYDKYSLIPAEMEDIDGGEGLDLAKTQIEYVPKYVKSFKKA